MNCRSIDFDEQQIEGDKITNSQRIGDGTVPQMNFGESPTSGGVSFERHIRTNPQFSAAQPFQKQLYAQIERM